LETERFRYWPVGDFLILLSTALSFLARGHKWQKKNEKKVSRLLFLFSFIIHVYDFQGNTNSTKSTWYEIVIKDVHTSGGIFIVTTCYFHFGLQHGQSCLAQFKNRSDIGQFLAYDWLKIKFLTISWLIWSRPLFYLPYCVYFLFTILLSFFSHARKKRKSVYPILEINDYNRVIFDNLYLSKWAEFYLGVPRNFHFTTYGVYRFFGKSIWIRKRDFGKLLFFHFRLAKGAF